MLGGKDVIVEANIVKEIISQNQTLEEFFFESMMSFSHAAVIFVKRKA